MSATRPTPPPVPEELDKTVAGLGLARAKRHVLLCTDLDCDSDEQTWRALQRRVRERGLRVEVQRTQVGCFGVCHGGPLMVVYPDGVWYRAVSPEVVERIVDEHFVADRVVDEHVFLTNPLPAATS